MASEPYNPTDRAKSASLWRQATKWMRPGRYTAHVGLGAGAKAKLPPIADVVSKARAQVRD